MKRYTPVLSAVWLALNPLSAAAQTRAGISAAAESSSSAGASAAAISAGIPVPSMNTVLPAGSLSPSLAPSPSPIVNTVQVVANVVKLQAVIPHITPGSLAHPSGKVTPSVAVQSVPSSIPASKAPSTAPLTRSERAVAVVRDEVANWGVARHPGDLISVEPSHAAPALAPARSAPSIGDPREIPPAPPSRSPDSSRPRLSKSLLISGAALVGLSLTAAAVPALLPAAIVAYKGALAWSGFAALAASRFWRSPGSAPDVPRGPPAPSGGAFSSFKSAWAAARDSAAAQRSFEARVGGASWSSFKDWLFGGLRTGLYWMGPALLLMLGGAVLAKGAALAVAAVVAKTAVVASAAASNAAINVLPMSFVFGSLLPMALASQAAGVALYFGVEAVVRRLGFGRAAPWLGGAAALGFAGAVLLTLTQAPFIVVVTLALEAGVIWSAARSRSFAVPLALRGILTVFSLEAARLAAWLSSGDPGVLVGLPAVWGGLAVAGLVALAWKLKSPGLRLREIGAWWNAPEPGQKPKSPGRILSAGLVWGLVVYAIGDLTFWGVNALSPGHEPAPAILAKMLTSSVDLVLYNFVIVGLLEEYVFRRGLFKMMNDKLEKWGLSLGKAFWLAAVGSALIFSGVHYIDWGAILAKIGMGDPAAASGLGGAYDFSWAGFVARSVLGVVLAWMYKRSGLLLIPIVAHFWADSMEGLGLRWGLPAFLALAAGALIVSFFFRPKEPKPRST